MVKKMKNLAYTLECQHCGKDVVYDRRGGAANFMIKKDLGRGTSAPPNAGMDLGRNTGGNRSESSMT
jgi:hypothetical protein